MAMPIVFQVVGAVTSPWIPMNPMGFSPMNISVAVEVVSGSISVTAQYTYDDPNNLKNGVTTPLAYSYLTPVTLGGDGGLVPPPTLTPAITSIDGFFNFPLFALRFVNTGTGTARIRILQAGIG